MSIIDETAKAAGVGDKDGLRDVLDFLVTEEQLGVTLRHRRDRARRRHAVGGVPAGAAQRGDPGVPSRRGAQGGRRHSAHHEVLVPRCRVRRRGVGLFSTLEIVETVEISLYLIGVSAYARAGEAFGARLCAEAMGTEAVHRALVRFAQGQLGKDVGVPNDVGFENFDWPTVAKVRDALEGLGIGYGKKTRQPGRFYEYPGDPIARGVGTPVSHTLPA